ncbi:MAG: hypothetical protein JST00_40775 [Deltaproteobacteria bacterium]|nr:hypothetical protein [Deltaproteobacteria bacterium]
MTSGGRRVAGFGIVAALVHGLALAAVPAATPADAAAKEARARDEVRADARRERSAILRGAEAEIAAGKTTLGETILRLGHVDRVEESGERTLAAHDRERALLLYREMLGEVRAEVARGEPIADAVLHATAKEGRAARYKRMYPRLVDALANGGGNCVALSSLAALLAHDAGFGGEAGFRVYANHVAPEVGGFHFGMVKSCHGEGVRVATKDLLFAYAQARATNDTEPFAFPRASDACDDPGDVFGALQLVASDPPAMPARAAGAAPARPAPAADDADCKRRTVLEEYDEDVELLGENGRTMGGVGVPRLATLDLPGHAKSAACFDRRVAAASEADPEAFVLVLADAALAAEDAARVFAAASELDVAREYERRLSAYRAKAAAPLERVIARLSSDDPSVGEAAIVMNAGRLVALGEGGRTAMMLASEHHRGFWEIANLMTRPSSQVGAIKRWGEKPPDVQRDVVAALPCASETFRAQLRSVQLPEASAILTACDERSRPSSRAAPAPATTQAKR